MRQKRKLEERTKRTAKRKQRRLKNEKASAELRQGIKKLRADAALVALRSNGEIIVGVRRGHFGHPSSPILRIQDEEIVGATEDVKELGAIATKLGVLALSQLFGYELAYGSEGLAKQIAKWAHIDVEALKKEIADEAGDADGGGAGDAAPGGGLGAAGGVPAREGPEAEGGTTPAGGGEDDVEPADVLAYSPHLQEYDRQLAVAEDLMDEHDEALERLSK